MSQSYQVHWTERSLRNASDIQDYLRINFSEREVDRFKSIMKAFERNVAAFPFLYPESSTYPQLRRAVLHKNLSVFYTVNKNKIIVVAMQDNRQNKPGK